MSGSRYPDYYLRKRRRESTYRRVVTIVVGIVLFAVIGGGTGFLVWNTWIKPKQTSTTEPATQAQERDELNTELRIADAQSNPPENAPERDNSRTSAPVSTELSEVEYSPSMPAVKVSIEGSNQPATKKPEPTEDTDPGPIAADEQGRTPTPPAEQEQPAAFTPPATTSGSDADKPESKPEADKPEEEEKPKPEETKPKPQPGAIVFHVYAGACRSKDEAEKMKSNLSALGFQASVIANNVDYLVRVASLEDYDSANALVSKLADSGFSNAFATRSRN